MNEIREDLKAYVDGELNETRAAEVAAAISADSELAQEAEFMKMLGFEIKRLAPEPAVEGRAVTILKVKNAKTGFRWSPISWSFAGQAAVCVLFVAVVVSIIFPVFAQSKEAAKRTAEMSASKNAATASEAQDSGLDFRADSKAGVDVDGLSNGAGEAIRGGGVGRGGYGFPEKSKSPATSSPEAPGELHANPTRIQTDKEAKTTVPMKGVADKRLVIKNADMSVRVASARKAMESAGTIADSLGGFVINSSSNDLQGVEPSGTVVLRVPATRFDLAMQKLRALGDVTNESSTGEDVTAQVADIGARIKVLRAEEDSYITMLRAARRVNEMLEIKERLSGVRQEIESLTAQVTALKDMATLSTITATFHQKVTVREPEEEPKGGFEETWAGAVNGLKSVGTFLANVVIVIFVYSPIWLPVVAIGWWLAKKNRKVS